MIIHANYQEVRALARQIGTLCLTMLELGKELEGDLNTLKKTLSDDGIEEIDRCLNGIFDALGLCQTDMIELSKTLFAHAARLEATK